MKDFDEHVWLEDIIYCPSQIYYYFEDDTGEFWCLYIRQRSGDLTMELVKVEEDNEGWSNMNNWSSVILSRDYDINNQLSEEKEREEIDAVEEEGLCFLRQRFPKVKFPDNPEKRGRGH
jgi:hypothetical protein